MNLKPWLETLSIIDKAGIKHRLDLDAPFAWAQRLLVHEYERQFALGRGVHIIVLKARQLGVSTVTQSILFANSFMWQDTFNALTVANEQDNSNHLLQMSDNYWELWPFKPLYEANVKYASVKKKEWRFAAGHKSSIDVKTAKNAQAGRSRTIHFLHGSEVAFWNDPETLMTGLRQAIPNNPRTAIILESTANGVGNYFHKLWKKSQSDDSEYTGLFFPWFRHPEYTAESIRIDPMIHDLKSQEERVLQDSFGVSDSRLAWRRYAIRELLPEDMKGSVDGFHQEYPSTPDEAFVSTGRNVFPFFQLVRTYQPRKGRSGRVVWDQGRARFVPDFRGDLTIFKNPSDDPDHGVYMIGGDPTRTTRGDAGCMQVLNRRTLEQVAVWRGRCDPASFGEEIARVGRYYNNAMVVPETTGPGYATIGYLQGIGYYNIWHHQKPDRTPGVLTGDQWGWATNVQTKNLAIGYLLKVVIDELLVIHDQQTFQEMRDYVTMDDGGYGPGDGSDFDDTVMALAIAVTAHLMEPPLLPYGEYQEEEVEPHEPFEQKVARVVAEAPWERWGNESEGDW